MVGFGVWFDHLSDQAGAVSVRAVELALDSHLDPTEIEWLAWRGPAAPHSGASAVPFRRPS